MLIIHPNKISLLHLVKLYKYGRIKEPNPSINYNGISIVFLKSNITHHSLILYVLLESIDLSYCMI